MLPKIYPAQLHGIETSLIDKDAIFIIRRLKEAGYLAYLVGGGVRDLLAKRKPKDFDISTSARPEEIKQLFQRQCLLIGRRFRLAHIRFGHKIFEVATFRSGDNEEGLITHDNEWGTAEQDVLRRDFTINGLFYDPAENVVIDYVGGWEDIRKPLLKTIGDPEKRFRQDPVRMLRLLKFRARLGFDIDPSAKQALFSCLNEIHKSSSARILEELLRMLESGAATPFFQLMNESGFLKALVPNLAKQLNSSLGPSIYQFLTVADKVNLSLQKKPLDRSILASCLLFPILDQALHEMRKQSPPPLHISEIIQVSSDLIKQTFQTAFTHFPKRISTLINFILPVQYRLTPLSGKKQIRPKLFNNKEFGLALQFLKLRAILDENLSELYLNWNHLYKQHREHHKDTFAKGETKKRRAKKNNRN